MSNNTALYIVNRFTTEIELDIDGMLDFAHETADCAEYKPLQSIFTFADSSVLKIWENNVEVRSNSTIWKFRK